MENHECCVWIFDCPIHGMQNQVLCFRAHDEANVDRWGKYRVVHTPIETTKAEREQWQRELLSDGP